MKTLSPFQQPTLTQPSASGQIGVQVQANTLAQVTQINTWIQGWQALQAELAQHIPVPAAVGLTCHYAQASADNASDLIMRTGPEELLILSPAHSTLPAHLRQAIAPELGNWLDLSHARCCINLQGPGTVATLQKLFALDLRPQHFPAQQIRMSGTHHTPATLYRQAEQQFQLIVPTTFAHDQLHIVLDAALEFGVQYQDSR